MGVASALFVAFGWLAVETDRGLLDPFEAEAPVRPAALILAVEARLIHRQLSFTGSVPQSSYATRLPTPALGLEASYRPGWLGHRLGLALGAELGHPARSETGEARYSSAHGELRAGAVAVFGSRPLAVLAQLSVGTHWWSFDATNAAAAAHARPIPGVGYHFLRTGAELLGDLGPHLGLRVGLFHRLITQAGPINWRDWYPGGSAYGLEATLGLCYRLSDRFEGSLQSIVRYYRHDFHGARPVQRLAADGARDVFVSFGVNLTARFGGD